MFRLLLLGVLLLLSLLTVCRAGEYHLWYLAIMVTEFPLIFIAADFVVLLGGFWTKRFRTAGTVLGVAALVLFLVPVFEAYQIGRSIDGNWGNQFLREKANRLQFTEKPFVFSRLWEREVSTADTPSVYTYTTDPKLTLDFYKGQRQGLKPCVVVIHGGSWAGGDSRQLEELNYVLATAGYNVVSINYRLAPQYPFPAPMEDVAKAIRYLKDHSGMLELDTNKWVLLGRSAGAQIALLAGYTLPETGIRGAVSFYGPADMVWGYEHPNSPLVMNSCKVMDGYLGGTMAQKRDLYFASSPIEFVRSHPVPTLLIHGENDLLVAYRHSTRMVDTFKKYRTPYYFLSMPWATHGFDYNLNGPGGQLSTYAVKRFLSEVFAN